MSRHRKAYVISYHGALCHDMSYVTTIVASLLQTDKWAWLHICFQKVSRHGSHRSYSELLHVQIVKIINYFARDPIRVRLR